MSDYETKVVIKKEAKQRIKTQVANILEPIKQFKDLEWITGYSDGYDLLLKVDLSNFFDYLLLSFDFLNGSIYFHSQKTSGKFTMSKMEQVMDSLFRGLKDGRRQSIENILNSEDVAKVLGSWVDENHNNIHSVLNNVINELHSNCPTDDVMRNYYLDEVNNQTDKIFKKTIDCDDHPIMKGLD